MVFLLFHTGMVQGSINFFLPYLALNSAFAAQMAWLGFFLYKFCYHPMPRRAEKDVALVIRTHVSRVSPGPGTFEGRSTN